MRRNLWLLFFGLSLVTVVAECRTLTVPEVERYNRLTKALIAPCCWQETIAIHRSAEALQMLDEVEQLVVAGRSEEEIKALYVARYGVRILADPPGRTGQWLYAIPFVLLGASLLLAAVRLRMVAGHAPAGTMSVPPDLLARIREETEENWSRA